MRTTLFLIAFLSVNTLHASLFEEGVNRSQYINSWADEAVYQMVIHRIPASVTLAQGIIESGDGTSKLAREANNHFGIKCHSDWQGDKVFHDDDSKGECFRKYADARQSFEDHSLFLKRPRYASLFEHKLLDYSNWANGLKECGYATSPTYAAQLIKVIEENGLNEYDKVGMEHIKKSTLPEGRTKPEPVAVLTDRKGKAKPGDEPAIIDLGQSREISKSNNRIKYVVAMEDETIAELAKELDVMPWQLSKYNDIPLDYRFSDNEVVYIQPKRGKAAERQHRVEQGETMRDISQKYGIKLKLLTKFNPGHVSSGPLKPDSEVLLSKPGK